LVYQTRTEYISEVITSNAHQKKLSGTGFLKKYLYEVTLRKFEPPAEIIVTPEARYRYYSGVKFDERFSSMLSSGNGGATKIAGQEGTGSLVRKARG
jgi:hypothetical protein